MPGGHHLLKSVPCGIPVISPDAGRCGGGGATRAEPAGRADRAGGTFLLRHVPGLATTAVVDVWKYDGTYPGSDGIRIEIGGSYEVQTGP